MGAGLLSVVLIVLLLGIIIITPAQCQLERSPQARFLPAVVG